MRDSVALLEQIVTGVYGVKLGFGNVFVVVDDAVTLIDTGLSRRSRRVTAALGELERSVTNIALTHYHFDHIGGLARLATPEQRVYVHPLDAPVVRGTHPHPPPAVGPAARAVLALLRPVLFGRLPPGARVDYEITDGDEIPGSGLRAIHTPGHTAGHVSYLHTATRVLIVGDAASHGRQGLGPPPRIGTEDLPQAERSLARLADLDFEHAVFGHGTVLSGAANMRFRKYVERTA